jgi:hypothetical protein
MPYPRMLNTSVVDHFLGSVEGTVSLEMGTPSPYPWDLSLFRQNTETGGTVSSCPAVFRQLSRRSGRMPALPYPPLRCS